MSAVRKRKEEAMTDAIAMVVEGLHLLDEARLIRETAGISSEEIAREVGVTRMTVSNWERGRSFPEPSHLRPYLAVLSRLKATCDLKSGEWEVRLVRLGDMQIPPYQRKEIPHKIKKMFREWNDSKVGVPLLSERDETLWVVDGQQRRAAALLKFGPDHALQCAVYRKLTREKEHTLYTAHNKERTNLSSLDLFLGDLAEGRKEAELIAAMLAAHNIKMQSSKSPDNRVTAAADTVTRLHRQGQLEEVLTLAAEGWTMPDGTLAMRAVAGDTLTFLGWFLQRFRSHPNYKHERLVTVLRRCTPVGVVDSARGAKGGHSREISNGLALAQLYNKGLSRSKQLPLPD